MTPIYFETHATSIDNENRIASGHSDAPLSRSGETQARELGTRYRDVELGSIHCSDLQRSYRTAEIAFSDRQIPVIMDARLRECDYGDLNAAPVDQVEAQRLLAIEQRFPNGESYQDVVRRTKDFLADLAPGQPVLVIGHRATWYALEHLLDNKPLGPVIESPWQWQPGWRYVLRYAQGMSLVSVYRSADMNAEQDATAIRNLLIRYGLHPEMLNDNSPGVVEGTWEVRVPAEEVSEAESLIADVPQDDPGAVDTSHEMDLVTVLRTDGATAEMEALAVKAMLDSNGISAVMVGSPALPNLGFEVKVASGEKDRAETAIREAQAAGPAAAVEAAEQSRES